MAKSRDKIYIVDGYNVLRSGPCYEKLTTGPDWTDDTFNLAREMLINDITFFCGREATATIVFDGTSNIYSDGHRQKMGNIDIVFSKAGKDADQTVIEIARQARTRCERVTVISGDAAIQNSVMGQGVARMSPRDFCNEVNSSRKEIDSHEYLIESKKSTIESTLSADTLAKLIAIRDKK